MNLTKLVLAFWMIASTLIGQDTLTTAIAKEYFTPFTIQGDHMVGDGADLIDSLLANNQFFMIGEYHNSARISAFTNALILQSKPHDFKHLVLEVGPHTGEMLQNFGSDKRGVAKSLYDHHQKYSYHKDEKSIPFFDFQGDAKFLQTALDHELNLIGIDQEFLYSFGMWIDVMYNKLEVDDQQRLKELHHQTMDSVTLFINQDKKKEIRISNKLTHHVGFQSYLDTLYAFSQNQALIDDLRTSIGIYYLNTVRKWYWNNHNRVAYMKQQFSKTVKEEKIDLSSEKMIVKMGGVHMSRGMSPMLFSDMGSLIGNLGDLYGNGAVNVTFINRYYEEDGVIKDDLADYPDDDKKALLALAGTEGWGILHLQPLIEYSQYYPLKFRITDGIKEMALRYDYAIIVPTDYSPKANY